MQLRSLKKMGAVPEDDCRIRLCTSSNGALCSLFESVLTSDDDAEGCGG